LLARFQKTNGPADMGRVDVLTDGVEGAQHRPGTVNVMAQFDLAVDAVEVD
jgi:hypothetical protein